MSIPEPSDPSNNSPFNRLRSHSSADELVPRATSRHVLSKEIEELADDLERHRRIQILYPVVYGLTRDLMDSGASHEELRAKMEKLTGVYGKQFAPDVKQAYEDALVGRRPRYPLK
jgi:hypothetical protein